MNNVILVGRLISDPEVKEMQDKTIKTTIVLAVSRGYKNSEGIYETDFIRCVLWNGIASATKDYCRKGDVIGLKGKLQSRSYEDKDEKKYITEVIADKITFISSVKSNSENKEKDSDD